MRQHELPKRIYAWSKRIGQLKARSILTDAGIGYTTAVFLVNGTYPSEPKGKTVLILEAILRAAK